MATSGGLSVGRKPSGKGLIPEKELDINVDDDGDILKLIELLQDHNLLLCGGLGVRNAID